MTITALAHREGASIEEIEPAGGELLKDGHRGAKKGGRGSSLPPLAGWASIQTDPRETRRDRESTSFSPGQLGSRSKRGGGVARAFSDPEIDTTGKKARERGLTQVL